MSRQALLIVDMQKGLFIEACPETAELVQKLNALAARLRARGLPVIFIQHCGADGHELHPSKPGHALHDDLVFEPQDLVITKKSCDAFLDTSLNSNLAELQIDSLIITGCATDFCVDTTIRSSLARGYATTVPEDGHTTFDRPNLSTLQVIEHHNMIWANFTSPIGSATITRCDAII